MDSHAASLMKAARLALMVSADPWAIASLVLPGDTVARCFCTAEDPAVAAALRKLADEVSEDGCDLPELGADTPGDVRSWRAVRRLVPYGAGQARIVVATAGAVPHARDPGVIRGLALAADLLADACRAPGDAHLPFQLLFESAPGLYLVLAPDIFQIVAASNAYLEATMVTRERIVNRSVFDVFPDDPADEHGGGVAALKASLERVRQTRQADVMALQRYPIRRPGRQGNGFEERYWSPINSPVLDPHDGHLMFIIHRVEDVTDYVLSRRPAGDEAEIVLRSHELKRMADSLAQSEQRLRYVTRATNDVVWDWRMEDDALWCSQSAIEPLGSVLARATRLADWDACIHPDDRDRVRASLRAGVAARREHWSAEYRLRLPDAAERSVLHRCFMVLDEHGLPQRMVGSIADLTDNKRQQARLRMQAEMLDYATDAILVRDLDNRVLYWNQAAAARYGWDSEQIIGRPVGETLYAQCAPADFAHAMQVLMRHGDYAGRMVHSAADGRKFIVHVHWILVRHEDGAPRAILSVVTDLSERIALEQRLLRIQKLESLGRLSGGLAHDFNNWLTVIIGNAEELVDALEGQAELREVASLIQMAGERGAQLTRRLLAFGRRQPLTPEVLKAGDALESLRPLIARSLPENIELRLLGTASPWCVHADRAQLEAAVVNLCINARDAMPAGGILTIQLMLAEMDEQKLALNKSLAPGEYVVIAIADTGQGIPLDVIEHVFEPFFTTKHEAGGSGLGLSMVYGFVAQSNGDVTIYSEPGHGTEVRLYLPRAYTEPEPALEHAPGAAPRPPRGCAVLLVEDDPIVRAHVAGQLRELGCEVTACPGAGEALSELAGGRHVDLLFTDAVMPGVSGLELAERARAMRPGLRVLLSSGYTFEALPRAGDLAPVIRFLNKPYGKTVLARVLADALAEPGRKA